MATTATYVSDSRIDVSWTVAAFHSGSSVRVVRQRADGAEQVIATLPNAGASQPMSYSDTSAQVDQKYRYRITGNVVLADRFDALVDFGNYVYTTPDAPSSVVAEKSSGGDVVVSWQDNSAAETHFEIQDGTTALGTKTASPYTHVAPSNLVPHEYRVRAVTTGPRYSAWSPYSNTVTILQAPAAPDNLTPNGSSVELAAAHVLSWDHAPLDTTPQEEYELRHRPVGSGTWTTVTGTTAEFRDISGAYVIAEDVEWQVRTKGAHVDFSPWSALATFSIVEAPTVLITAPVDLDTLATSDVTVEWSYFHSGGNAQTGWQVEVLDGSLLVAQGVGADDAAEWSSGNVLDNATTYTIRVRVRESSGLWSDWESVTVDVDFPTPAASTGSAEWVDGFGHVLLTAQAVDDGVSPETVAHEFSRSVDGGNTWTVVATDIPLDTNLLDWEAPAGGTYHYRITALSALPSATHTEVEVTVPATDINCAIWVSGGPGFANAAQIAWNPLMSVNGGRDRRLNVYSRRTHPVETSSRQVPRTLSVQATIFPDRHNEDAATVEDLQDIFDVPGPHLYRDHTGLVMYGTLSPLDASTGVDGVTSVSFSITRTARGTDAQLASLSEFYAPRIAEVAPGVYQVIGADVVEAAPGVYEEVE